MLRRNNISHSLTPEQTWTGPLRETATLFYQGMYETQTLALRYIGQENLRTTTNEVVYLRGANILTIPQVQLWLYPEIDEINRHPSIGITMLFMQLIHWMQGISEQHAELNTEYEPLYPTNETGSVIRFALFNDKSSLGQATDIAAHKRKYDELVKKNITKILLKGVSRGTVATLIATAVHQYENISLCVLEAPPGTISSIFKHYSTKQIGKLLYTSPIARYFLGEQHKTEREHQAIAYAERFPTYIPLVIVSSLNDGIVIHKTSLSLAMLIAGHRLSLQQQYTAPVYFLQLDNSGHNYYALGQTADSMRYQNFIHAVYKRHQLPYIQSFAAAGEHELKVAELTQGPLSDQVRYQYQFKFFKSKRANIRQKAFNELSETVSHLNDEEKTRAIKICAEMPLYKKELTPRYTLFSKSQVLRNLEALKPTTHRVRADDETVRTSNCTIL
jgi:hypothetical protein